MSRAVLVLHNDHMRQKAIHWVNQAPVDTRVEFKAPKRTLPQNARLWASLTDVADQVMWHGVKLTSDDWKLIFMDALNREVRIVPNVDGDGFVNIGVSSSKLTKEEMSGMIELIHAFGANPDHPVTFHDDKGEE